MIPGVRRDRPKPPLSRRRDAARARPRAHGWSAARSVGRGWPPPWVGEGGRLAAGVSFRARNQEPLSVACVHGRRQAVSSVMQPAAGERVGAVQGESKEGRPTATRGRTQRVGKGPPTGKPTWSTGSCKVRAADASPVGSSHRCSNKEMLVKMVTRPRSGATAATGRRRGPNGRRTGSGSCHVGFARGSRWTRPLPHLSNDTRGSPHCLLSQDGGERASLRCGQSDGIRRHPI